MKPHRMDGVSLTFGLLFLLIAGWWALSRVVTLQLPALGWTVAAGLILFGVVGLLGAIRSGRRDQPAEPTPPVQAETRIEGDVPPEMHASIVQELLDDPAQRFEAEHPGAEGQKPRNMLAE
ncbi:phage holin family protein [Actinoplanes sp. NPDC051851]|uniref:phage holin family protein n=1 Tax=Actinoplanes sp. NPDC051851 TaxID=3154753 RepID=UPI0034414581